VRLCRISHGSCVTVGGVIGRNLQPLCGGSCLQHGTFRGLLKSFFGFPVFRLGGKAEVPITPTFCSGHESFILLLRKVSNYDIQIGVRHFSFPHAPISAFDMTKYAIAKEPL
jgi:hypothetical protein